MHTPVRVTLELAIHDEQAFREQAQRVAISDGDHNPVRFLNADETDLGDCAQMILDPGEGPPGSSIQYSSGVELACVFEVEDEED